MNDHTQDPTPSEIDAGRDAVRELAVEPLPSDVLARLEGRLEGESGLRAPVRRKIRRRPRLAFAAPGLAVALAAVVAIAVIAERGSDGRPQQVTALSQFKQASPTAVPKAQAKASAGASAQTDSAAVRVPTVVGKSLGDARTALSARGLHAVVRGTCTSQISQQKPAPGALAAAGGRVRLICAQ